MEQFKQKLRQRVIYICTMLIVFSLIMASLMLFLNHDDTHISDFIRGFQAGIFLTVEIVLVYYTVRYSATLRNEEALKKIYIEETDERTLMIQQKSGSVGMELVTFGLVVAAVISGYFDQKVFLTLLGAVAFVVIIRLMLKLYYRNKF